MQLALRTRCTLLWRLNVKDELHSHLNSPKEWIWGKLLNLLRYLCYDSAEHQKPNLYLPPPPQGSTVPSFQWFQSHWDIATAGKSLCLPLAPGCEPGCTPWSRGSGMEASSHWEEADPSCLTFMRAVPVAPAVTLGYLQCEGCRRQSGQVTGWAHRDFPEAVKTTTWALITSPWDFRECPPLESLSSF